jgi:membrane protein YdbS with pleckstrin-like domain
MALIQCSECRREVSSLAPACPQCGAPIAAPAARAATPVQAQSGGISLAGLPGVVSASSSAAAAAVPDIGEQTLWEGSPSLKALVMHIISSGVYVSAVLAAAWYGSAYAFEFEPSLPPNLRILFEAHPHDAFLALVAVVALLVLRRLLRLAREIAELKTQHYRITNQRIVISRGVFSRRVDEIDIRTVDDLECRQTFLERVLGIGRIVIVSKDRIAGRYVLIGLGQPRELREQLRANAYQASRGQLFMRQG